jgi:hypothetical protein
MSGKLLNASFEELPVDHPVKSVIGILGEKFVSRSAKRMKDLDLMILRECKELVMGGVGL